MSFTTGSIMSRATTQSWQDRPATDHLVNESRHAPALGVLIAFAVAVPFWVAVGGLVYALT